MGVTFDKLGRAIEVTDLGDNLSPWILTPEDLVSFNDALEALKSRIGFTREECANRDLVMRFRPEEIWVGGHANRIEANPKETRQQTAITKAMEEGIPMDPSRSRNLRAIVSIQETTGRTSKIETECVVDSALFI